MIIKTEQQRRNETKWKFVLTDCSLYAVHDAQLLHLGAYQWTNQMISSCSCVMFYNVTSFNQYYFYLGTDFFLPCSFVENIVIPTTQSWALPGWVKFLGRRAVFYTSVWHLSRRLGNRMWQESGTSFWYSYLSSSEMNKWQVRKQFKNHPLISPFSMLRKKIQSICFDFHSVKFLKFPFSRLETKDPIVMHW